MISSRNCLFFLMLLGLGSCRVLPTVLTPSLVANDVSYLPKPMEVDSVKSRNYISGSIGGQTLPYNSGDVSFGMLNFSRAHTTKNFNFAYGVFGFAGQTTNEGSQRTVTSLPEFDRKGLFGWGLRSSIGYYDNAGNAEFRILSWENALSFENGAYANLRKRTNYATDPEIFSSKKTTLYTTGFASEIIWHGRRTPTNQFAFRLFYGFTPGLSNSLRDPAKQVEIRGGAFDFAFYVKLNKLFAILNSGVNKGTGSKLSLGYSF